MENTIIIIVLIIAFNLIRRFLGAGAAKQKAAGQTGRSRVIRPAIDQPFDPTDETAYYHSSRREKELYSDQAREMTGLKQSASLADDRSPGKTGKSGESKPAQAGVAGKTGPAARSLQRVLRERNSLVAAFIFHEVLDSPSARRRGKQTVFNRIK